MKVLMDRLAIQDLYADYAACLDRGDLDGWLDLFADQTSYKIIPRDNVELGLPLCLVLCESRGMLRDRVTALQQANEYAIHVDRHIVSGIRARETGPGVFRVTANFCIFQSDSEGNASLFLVGVYDDEVEVLDERARFLAKTAVVDNFCIPHAISTPV